MKPLSFNETSTTKSSSHACGQGMRMQMRSAPWLLVGLILGSCVSAFSQTVSFDQIPRNMQVYPRDVVSNTATVRVSGVVESPGYDRVALSTYRNGRPGGMTFQALAYDSATNASFSLASTITAELAPYNFEVQLVQGAVTTTVHSVTNVVAGDLYMINGQSNAEARMFSGSANGNQGPFVRAFGTRDDNGAVVAADLNWHLADGNAIEGPGASGQWSLRLARRLVDAYGIPIGLINEARGGQAISYFQRDDSSHENLANNYGRTLLRVREAGATQHLRGILWYQGESDAGNGSAHETGFVSLYNDWRENYPTVERIYVHQLRVGCGVTKNDVDLRDRQRRLADRFPDISVMSTTGINSHDGCHYAYTGGYETIGDHIFALIARDLYGAPDLPNIEAPNVTGMAVFGDGARTSLVVRTRNHTDSLIFDAGAEADFLIAGAAVAVTGGQASSNRLTLALSGDATGATSVSYTGHSGWGPWVTNALGVGLLTFTIPISTFVDVPGTPTNLQASATPLLQAELHWDPVSNAASYVVRRDALVIGATSQAAFTDTGLAPFSNYNYDVAGVNPLGTSVFSSVAAVLTPGPPPPPATPTGLVAAAVSISAIDLHWPTVSNTVHYLIQRDGSVVDQTVVAHYTDTGLTTHTTYDYAIAAVNPVATSAFSTVASATTFEANVFAFAPESTNYVLAYRIDIPDAANFRNATAIPYTVNNAAAITACFDRVAYYLELDTGSGLEWVYTSMDAFTSDIEQLGLPHNVDNPVNFQQTIFNLNVVSSAGAGVTTGLLFSTGNIEMWPSNYGMGNDAGIPGASASDYDFGDGASTTLAGYGSFQVHNHGAGETLLAYNRWGTTGNSDLGIGNRPVGEPDWTFSQNAATYLVKNLEILVRPLRPVALTAPENLVVSDIDALQATLGWDPVPGGHPYEVRINGTPAINSLNAMVTLTGLAPNTSYHVDVSAVSCAGKGPYSSATSFTTQVASVYSNVAEAAGFELLYVLDIEEDGNYQNATPVPYNLDRSAQMTQAFDRVAYYLELDNTWVFVSMDPFTANPQHLGLPHNTLGTQFQQSVAAMRVLASSNANVTTGAFFKTGNIEFWPNSYAQGNAAGVPNADGGTFDFGDAIAAANPGYSCLQIHNHDVSGSGTGSVGETILAYNNWGFAGIDDLGIGSQLSGNPDWTFARQANTISVKRLYVLTRPVDADMDGLADIWEVLHFGSITNANATSDGDGDGFPDLGEFVAGTVPTNPLSRFEVSIHPTLVANEFVVQWPGVSGRVYDVEASTNGLKSWTVWSSNILYALPVNTFTNAIGTFDRAFYRVRVRPHGD